MGRWVVIVGAGPAGITAAKAARWTGADVMLLDAVDRGTGRYHPQPSDAYVAAPAARRGARGDGFGMGGAATVGACRMGERGFDGSVGGDRGAGPAGIAVAKVARRAGAEVMLLDVADQAGGQYHR